MLRSIFSINHFWDRLSMFQLLRPHLVSIAYVFVIFASCLPCTFAAYDFRSGIQCIALICCFIWLLTSAIFLQVIDMFLDQWTVDCNLCYSRHRERYLQKLHSSRCRSDIRSIVIYVTLGFVSSKRWMSGLVPDFYDESIIRHPGTAVNWVTLSSILNCK